MHNYYWSLFKWLHCYKFHSKIIPFATQGLRTNESNKLKNTPPKLSPPTPWNIFLTVWNPSQLGLFWWLMSTRQVKAFPNVRLSFSAKVALFSPPYWFGPPLNPLCLNSSTKVVKTLSFHKEFQQQIKRFFCCPRGIRHSTSVFLFLCYVWLMLFIFPVFLVWSIFVHNLSISNSVRLLSRQTGLGLVFLFWWLQGFQTTLTIAGKLRSIHSRVDSLVIKLSFPNNVRPRL